MFSQNPSTMGCGVNNNTSIDNIGENQNESFDVGKLVSVLLKSENRDKMRELKEESSNKIEELSSSILTHKRRVEGIQLELNAARTNLQSPRLILEEIASHKRHLTEARKIIERCEAQIALLEAKLPADVREENVKRLETRIAEEEKTIESLSAAKSLYSKIRAIISDVEDAKKALR